MPTAPITPVILCGGSGTRLWPLSRKSYPKQFSSLLDAGSLFQASVQRLSGSLFKAPVVVTGNAFRFIVTEQLQEIGLDPGAVLIEPEGRNTAPAILAAAFHLQEQDPDAVMLVAPSDHVINDLEQFHRAVEVGLAAARAGHLVTFGVIPDRAETGYGYLELTDPIPDGPPCPIALRRFVEKPSPNEAAQFVQSGTHLWNAGIFLFSVTTILEAFRAHAPDMIPPVGAAVYDATPDLGFLRLSTRTWDQVRDVSVDYAIMEHAQDLCVVPLASDWSDLGGWDAVWRQMKPDAQGVATHGRAYGIACHNTMLRSEHDGQALVGIGLENLVAVAMPDAVLVADMSHSQDVRRAVQVLKDNNARQAETFPRDHRPWGWFETLSLGSRFQVKRIVVHPGATLSLQSHHHRSEHWIVVEGTARVTVGDTEHLLTENQSAYIPLGAEHRLENPGRVPMVLIEVQTGAYLGEDDIIRYEDFYARG